MVTIFAHVKDVENPFYKEINEILLSFKDGSNKSKIDKIRNIEDKDLRNKEKSKLELQAALHYFDDYVLSKIFNKTKIFHMWSQSQWCIYL